MIVELEPGVWIADGEGDPPRTTVRENAKHFFNMEVAALALIEARKYRPFPCAVITSSFYFRDDES